MNRNASERITLPSTGKTRAAILLSDQRGVGLADYLIILVLLGLLILTGLRLFGVSFIQDKATVGEAGSVAPGPPVVDETVTDQALDLAPGATPEL
ncbi:MAG: hypothetical protein KDD69_14240, partial [Bdellovibrionales bacterium]|nr:hypothetical protein [Bdellovibrionales bacterium]